MGEEIGYEENGENMAKVDIEPTHFMSVIEKNAINNEKLSNSIDLLTSEVKEIHEKYRTFSTKMTIISVEMAFLIAVSIGILLKI